MDAVQRKQARNSRNANHDKRGKNNNDRRSRGPIEPTIDSQLNGRTFAVGSIGFIEFDIRHRLYLVRSSSAKVIRQALEI
jgi:hypothetical protein